MDVAMIGLGRMGANMARRLLRGGHRVVVYNRTFARAEELAAEGAEPMRELADVVAALGRRASSGSCCPTARRRRRRSTSSPRGSSRATSSIDGGNAFFKEDIARGAALAERGLRYLDVGTSGGVWGLEVGYCMMVGGERSAFEHVEPLLRTLAPDRRRLRLHGRARRRSLRQDGPQRRRVRDDAGLRRGLRAARGRALGPRPRRRSPRSGTTAAWCAPGCSSWPPTAFAKDPELEGIRGYVEDTGEGRWTVEQSIELGVPLPVIALSLYMRFRRARTTRSAPACSPPCATSSAATR